MVCNPKLAVSPIAIQNPNGTIMFSSHTGTLSLSSAPLKACQAHIVPNFASDPLVSIAKLCNANCKVTFDKKAVKIQRHGKTMCFGHCNSDGL